MIQITCENVLAIAHRIYGYDGKCERLHGHNYRILITLSAPSLGGLGMIEDFTKVKKELFGALDELWDHRTLLWEKDPLCEKIASIGDGSLCPLPFNPTAENFATYLGENFFPNLLKRTFPQSVAIISVQVFESEKSSATWIADK